MKKLKLPFRVDVPSWNVFNVPMDPGKSLFWNRSSINVLRKGSNSTNRISNKEAAVDSRTWRIIFFFGTISIWCSKRASKLFIFYYYNHYDSNRFVRVFTNHGFQTTNIYIQMQEATLLATTSTDIWIASWENPKRMESSFSSSGVTNLIVISYSSK